MDPATKEGIASVDQERKAAKEALKLTSLQNADIYLGGTAATFYDIANGAKYDLMIAAVASIVLIFIIMVIVTRAFGRCGRHRRHDRDVAGGRLRVLDTDLAAPA